MDGATLAAMSRKSWLAISLLTLYGLGLAWLYRGLFLDDAYIVFRYVDNFLYGHGLTFNPPARVEGVTDIGWVLLLSPLARFAGAPAAAKILGIAGLGLTLFFLYRAARSSGDLRLPLLALALTASQADLITFSLLGMETSILAALLLGLTVLAERKPDSPALPLLAAAGFLLHPEAVLVYPLAAAISRRISWKNALLFGGTLAGITLVRWLYFGEILPNTFRSKPPSLPGIGENLIGLARGSVVNISFPCAGLIVLPFLIWGYRTLRREHPQTAAWAAAISVTGYLFAVYARPDWTEMGRYFAPYAPAALLLLAAGIQQAALRLRLPWIALAAIAILTLPGLYQVIVRVREENRLTYPGYVMTSRTLIEPSLWIRDHLPAGTTIATRRIGTLAFYSRLPVFDYAFGLTEPEVAPLVRARAGREFTDPTDPALASVWNERRPACLLEDGELIRQLAALGESKGFAIHSLRYRPIRSFRIGRGAEWVLACR